LEAEGAFATAHTCRPESDVVEQSPLTIAPAINSDWLIGVVGRAEADGGVGRHREGQTGSVTVPRECLATDIGGGIGIRPVGALEGHVERAGRGSGRCCGADGRDHRGHEPDGCGLGDEAGRMDRPSEGEAQSYHETIPSYSGPRRADDLRGTTCRNYASLVAAAKRHSLGRNQLA